MKTVEIVPAVAQHVEDVLGPEKFRFVSTVVANCKMLALQLEEQEQKEEEGGKVEAATGNNETVDMEALIVAAYLHDISTAEHDFHGHHLTSAQMAVEYLRTLDMPEERIQIVEQAIMAHTTMIPLERRETVLIEGRILYDADQLGRLSGLSVVTALIEFGARYPKQAITSDILAAILRHIEERFVELYQSLNTAPAREMAQEKFNNTLAFLDGVIEHLSDSTPV
jgi:HD superfamily phosphodiesterase